MIAKIVTIAMILPRMMRRKRKSRFAAVVRARLENAAPRKETAEKNGESNGLDASALPPAISQVTEVEVEKKPARKKRVPKPQPVEEGDAA